MFGSSLSLFGFMCSLVRGRLLHWGEDGVIVLWFETIRDVWIVDCFVGDLILELFVALFYFRVALLVFLPTILVLLSFVLLVSCRSKLTIR